MANVLGSLFEDIASAIREKTGAAETMKPAEFPEKISGISSGGVDVSGVTATAGDVLKGKVFIDSEGNEVEGTIPALFNSSIVFTPKYYAATLIEAYYKGSSQARVSYIDETVTPTKETQTFVGTDNFIKDLTVNPIPDEYQDVSNVTATAEDVLEGKVIVDAEGNEIVGTLVIKEAPAPTVDEIWAGAETSNGLAGSGIIRYVTFMNYDGTVEYGRKSVIKGENCTDPVTGGHLAAPSRESTPQYNYTYAGWATEANGGLNSNALKAVTEDRTVYANFVSVLRYYTVTFYDEDGVTVLATKSCPYNAMPDYTPVKVGYTFDGWTTEIVPVTEDASYVATWIGKVDFAKLTWKQIEAYAKAGDADKYIELGAEKTFVTTDGVTVTARVIGFNHDDLSDGTGKAGLTLEFDSSTGYVRMNSVVGWYSSGAVSAAKNIWWGNCDTRNYWNDRTSTTFVWSKLPSDLKAVIKQVRKVAYNTADSVMSYSDDFLWLPSCKELGFAVSGSVRDEGTCYAIYTPGKDQLTAYPDLVKYHGGTAAKYLTRSKESATIISAVSDTGMKSTHTLGTDGQCGFACFCI